MMAEVVLALGYIEVLGEIFKREALLRQSMSRAGCRLFLLPPGEVAAAG